MDKRVITSQLEIPEKFDFLFENHPYKAIYGGRGSAKTQSVATALPIIGVGEPMRVICAREIQQSIAESVKAELEAKIFKYGLNYFYNITDTYIEGNNGTLFVFRGLRTNPQAITSFAGANMLWVEEGQSVSQRSLDLAFPTIRGSERNKRAEIIATWNPRDPKDAVEKFFRSGAEPPPGSVVREVNYKDNPFFPNVLRQLMEYDRRRDPDRYNHIWLGRYLTLSQARVFKNWRIEAFAPPTDAEFSYGADWGFSVDPSVLIRCYTTGKTLFIDREAWAIGCPIDQLPALFDTIQNGHARKWIIRADSARPETIDYMKKHGYPRIIGATKGPGSVEDGIEFLQSFDIVVHPRCVHTIDELTFYSWKTAANNDNEILPILADKKNHTIDSLRYATEGTRRSSYARAIANLG
jgi:phage terminase large subunit